MPRTIAAQRVRVNRPLLPALLFDYAHVHHSMRILLLTPWVPYPPTGADQQDRFCRITQLLSMGHEVKTLAKVHAFQNQLAIYKGFAEINAPLTLIPYVRSHAPLLLSHLPQIVQRPALLDGAALEYTDPVYLEAMKKMIEEWKPDIAFVDFCFLWPLFPMLRTYGIPIVLRSANNEAQMAMDEHGGNLLSRMKAIPKFWTEKIVARESDVLLAITPAEQAWYRSQGGTNVMVLPLSGLPDCLETRVHVQKDVLNVVFLSSNYSMRHNRDALEFLLTRIMPLARTRLPGRLKFFLTGKKFPAAFRTHIHEDTETVGFVDDLPAFLRGMDIALCPWLTGQGMQQKVFEPLCRSLPLLTTHTAGYPFVNGEDLLLCKTPEDYVAGLERLLDPALRQSLSEHAHHKAQTLFGRETLQKIMEEAFETARSTVHSSGKSR